MASTISAQGPEPELGPEPERATSSQPSSTAKAEMHLLPMTICSGKAAIQHATATYAEAFSTDPYQRYSLTPIRPSSSNDKATHPIHSPAVRTHLWRYLVTQAAVNGGHIVNATGDWSSVGIYFDPGTSDAGSTRMLLPFPPHTGGSSVLGTALWIVVRVGPRMLWRGAAYDAALRRLRKRYFKAERLRRRDFFYVAVLATLEGRRGEGLGSAWIRWLQARAAEVGRPVWLETSTEGARRMYERCGFRCVGCERMGVGWVDEEGWWVEDERARREAKGVALWGMVWWPEGVEEERR
ncbi:uncharacterized protein HMPREF1541_08660 [Cyphellophora europaea CBS 101466]|uniref:N-acetyltransferase domain-containing protein n=1 Tax=Cyphellophora europaea (strain CBS 101466) TaxID=1220924 RepID=W2RL17_CYPE1|nr:uncharacterized protein HMPREF1541_08660 [Cyphellophora europaea CBS 101466]ETN36383.1 hypothetical protein HMPREF1541_08660 [Cyphellophora europaea CBS 101466]